MATLVAVLAGTGAALHAPSISGKVTIQERPGEVTEDIQNVVVFLEALGAPASKAPKLNPTNTTVALQSRQFSPRVRVITEGSKVEFANQDPFSHNVFSKTNGGFDTGVYGRGKTKDQTFKEAGVYPIYCNVHPRMTAFIIALSTPLYTQAGNDGRFMLEGVPPGQYRLSVWHDRTTISTQDVTVGAAGLSNLRVQLDARGYKYVQHKNKVGKDYTSATGDRY
ncbi:MAG: plastocyanin/azurin family copper-binding protein [Gemmatimonadota bacterium]